MKATITFSDLLHTGHSCNSVPYGIGLVVSNARCIMCGIDFDKKSKAVIKKDLFEKITREISQHRDHVEKVELKQGTY